MPTDEQRQRIVLEFLTAGNPQAGTDAANKQTEAIQKLSAAVEKLTQVQGQNTNQQQPHVQKIQQTKTALDEASDAAYKFGMGAVWSGVPFTGFVAQSGNVIN